MPAKLTTIALWTPVAPAERVKKHHGVGKNPLRVSLHDGRKNLSVFWDESTDGAGIVNDTCHLGARHCRVGLSARAASIVSTTGIPRNRNVAM